MRHALRSNVAQVPAVRVRRIAVTPVRVVHRQAVAVLARPLDMAQVLTLARDLHHALAQVARHVRLHAVALARLQGLLQTLVKCLIRYPFKIH